jgi:hypothetical protein
MTEWSELRDYRLLSNDYLSREFIMEMDKFRNEVETALRKMLVNAEEFVTKDLMLKEKLRSLSAGNGPRCLLPIVDCLLYQSSIL